MSLENCFTFHFYYAPKQKKSLPKLDSDDNNLLKRITLLYPEDKELLSPFLTVPQSPCKFWFSVL